MEEDSDFEEESVLKFYRTANQMTKHNSSLQKSGSIDNKNLDKAAKNLEEITNADLKPSTTIAHDKHRERKEAAKRLEELTYADLKPSTSTGTEYCIYHPPKYKGPIYHEPEFKKKSLEDQVKMLCSYHTLINNEIAQHSSYSLLDNTPPPKFRNLGTYKRNSESSKGTSEGNQNSPHNSLDNMDETDVLTKELDETYICKSGRITKRKFYSELIPETKKSKVADSWINCSKTSQPTKSLVSGRKLTTEAQKPIGKSLSSKFMEKSPFSKERNPRLAKIAEATQQKLIETKIEEEKMEAFSKTLSNSEDMFPDEDEELEKIKKDLNLSSSRPKSGKRQKKEPFPELNVTSIRRNYTATGRATQKDAFDKLKAGPSSIATASKKVNKNKVQCPICSNSFEEKEIENHASSCGENMVETRSRFISRTCGFCDKLFHIETDFEKHTASCVGNLENE